MKNLTRLLLPLLCILALTTWNACGRDDIDYRSQNPCGEYEPGEVFLDEEGCNTCACDTDGNIACTAMACIDPCGDGVCAEDESALSCPTDCKSSADCGDGVCGADENSGNCPQDCQNNNPCAPNLPGESFPAGDGCNTCVCFEDGTTSCTAAFCEGFCGDGECLAPDENVRNCPDDCAVCGDGICNAQAEDARSCPQDCAGEIFCGDGVCERGEENRRNCPEDCDDDEPTCGDGICEGRAEERNCPEDCAPTPATCGNDACEAGESPDNCPDDCPLILCEPFVSAEDNGCDEDGQNTCFATQDDFDGDGSPDGVCLPSGDTPEGGECFFDGENIFGSCQGDSVCVPTQNGGAVCSAICESFDGEPSCDDGQACAILGAESPAGYCTVDVEQNAGNPLESCFTPGNWCNDESICIEVDQQGNSVCIPLCRLNVGDSDCPPEAPVCDNVFQDPVLGACLPQ